MGLRSAAPASPVISAGVARAAAPGPLPLARAPSQTPVTAYWRRLLGGCTWVRRGSVPASPGRRQPSRRRGGTPNVAKRGGGTAASGSSTNELLASRLISRVADPANLGEPFSEFRYLLGKGV